MYFLIVHGRRSLELQKLRHLRVSVQNAFSFPSSFSSASGRDGRKGQFFTFSYLVDSLGLTAKLAESISNKVSFEEKRNPDSVLNLFRSYGFTDSQISTIITDYPRLLMLDAEKSIGPKLKFLLSTKGVSSTELTDILSKVPKILGMKGEKTISRYYDFVKEIIKADKSSKFQKLCHSLPQGMQENKIRNVAALRELGVPQRLLLPLLISDRKLVCGKEKFEESLKKVVEMGFDPTSSKFVEALSAIQKISKKAIDQKAEVCKSLDSSGKDVWEMFKKYPTSKRVGLEMEDVREVFKKCPTSLRLSQWKIVQTFESLKKCGLLKEEIFSLFKKYPRCIGYSEEKIAKTILTFQDLGFSKDEIVTMVKQFPQCLNISRETVKKKTKFLVKKKNKFCVKKMKWPLRSVVACPEVLGYSMEKRILPRCNVMKALLSKGLLGNRESELPEKESVLICTDQEFLKRFVRNHDDKKLVAELMSIYTRD